MNNDFHLDGAYPTGQDASIFNASDLDLTFGSIDAPPDASRSDEQILQDCLDYLQGQSRRVAEEHFAGPTWGVLPATSSVLPSSDAPAAEWLEEKESQSVADRSAPASYSPDSDFTFYHGSRSSNTPPGNTEFTFRSEPTWHGYRLQIPTASPPRAITPLPYRQYSQDPTRWPAHDQFHNEDVYNPHAQADFLPPNLRASSEVLETTDACDGLRDDLSQCADYDDNEEYDADEGDDELTPCADAGYVHNLDNEVTSRDASAGYAWDGDQGVDANARDYMPYTLDFGIPDARAHTLSAYPPLPSQPFDPNHNVFNTDLNHFHGLDDAPLPAPHRHTHALPMLPLPSHPSFGRETALPDMRSGVNTYCQQGSRAVREDDHHTFSERGFFSQPTLDSSVQPRPYRDAAPGYMGERSVSIAGPSGMPAIPRDNDYDGLLFALAKVPASPLVGPGLRSMALASGPVGLPATKKSKNKRKRAQDPPSPTATAAVTIPCRWNNSKRCPGIVKGNKGGITAHLKQHHFRLNDKPDNENRHLPRWTNGKTRCLWPDCTESLLGENLGKHISRAHTFSQEGVQCTLCGDHLPENWHLKRHMKTNHPNGIGSSSDAAEGSRQKRRRTR
ncbi:hypothetical protein PLICRDRAFT_52164 [Plicaturopsis crispa FD-325 SS-3]|nr:hypothetical protein PLICRDRAFT_52164 [Plicaturopsis crispa FD-325 SS-3]